MRLDLVRAQRALAAFCQSGFACAEDAAEGIVRVANVHMESALRRVSVERGYDPRDFTLIAFGGAGPLHACGLADALGIRRVLIPGAPGALSALGILDADLRREFSRTVMVAPQSAEIEGAYRALEAEARRAFEGEKTRPVLTRSADLRYRGQGFELRVPWGRDAIARFHRLHAQSFGYAHPARSVEVVTLRVHAVLPAQRRKARAATMKRSDGREALLGPHRIFEDGCWRKASLYDRNRLRAGCRIKGPAVIVELSATTYLPTQWNAAVDGHGNLLLTPSKGGRA